MVDWGTITSQPCIQPHAGSQLSQPVARTPSEQIRCRSTTLLVLRPLTTILRSSTKA